MARKIIILESNPVLPGEITFRFAMWADVPVTRQARYANPALTSDVNGATASELDAIRSGAVVERIEEGRWPKGTTVPQVQAELIKRFQAFQADVSTDNRWARYGTSWDGASWTPVTNG